MESEDFKNVFLTVLTKRIVWKQTRTLLLLKGGLSRDDFLGENSAARNIHRNRYPFIHQLYFIIKRCT